MITIYSTSTGAIVKRVASTDGESMAGRSSVADPDGYSETTHRWDASQKAMVADASMADAPLIASIDGQRRDALDRMLTSGEAISYVYTRKAMEVFDYRSLLSGVLTTLVTDAQKRARFPFAMAEVDLTGDSLATVLQRYEAGIAASTARLARYEALAQRAKRAIRAASTVSAKQAAAVVDWEA